MENPCHKQNEKKNIIQTVFVWKGTYEGLKFVKWSKISQVTMDEHTTRGTGPDRKKTGTGPGPNQIIILMGRFLGLVFINNQVSGLDCTVPELKDLTRTGPENQKLFSFFIDKQ